MRVLGIDPGFDRLGFGVVDLQGSLVNWVSHGIVQTSKYDLYGQRLQQVRDGMKKAILDFSPDVVAVEQLFFSSNAKTAMQVGMARGVILLEIADAGIALVEVMPNQVKQGLTGWGAADKKAIQHMVQVTLKLDALPKPDDAADALAIAIVGGMFFRHPK
ncbi:crossover junction endodeoxyribonuclease RuvC [Candidatus Uhrbacteria bacterium]|nr:crossover junction endodeoxyribonuclease RuvC [Candidatus Uhrbacteria bacterium]